ncbi:DNA-binding transcription factor yap1 [Massospora cicadina]|nr:DNA-binding transcription factor yap1 [Massospora cicadina]
MDPTATNESTEWMVGNEKRLLPISDLIPDKQMRIGASEKVRKKPGRKPSNTEPANKRLAQNRAAQRAFRDRKDNYVKTLEAKVKELENARLEAEERNQLLLSKLKTLNGSPPELNSSFRLDSLLNSEATNHPDPPALPVRPTFNPPSPIVNSEPPAFKPSLVAPNFESSAPKSCFSEFHRESSEAALPGLEDYMVPFNSYLSYTPQFTSEDPLPSQSLSRSFDSSLDVTFDHFLASYNYSRSFPYTGTGLPTGFDPVLYADFIQNSDWLADEAAPQFSPTDPPLRNAPGPSRTLICYAPPQGQGLMLGNQEVLLRL